MTIIDTLITDRTEEDVERVRELKSKILAENGGGLSALTEDEYKEYFAGMKGAYNYTDLNRVGAACAYLYDRLTACGLEPSPWTEPKLDWSVFDIPTREQMSAYLSNIAAMRQAAKREQVIPASMTRLTLQSANNIEKVLIEIEEYVTQIMNGFLYSGEFVAGQF